MGVRWSCNDYAWPALRHPTVLAIIADLGFDGVDIGVFDEATHVSVSSVVADPRRRADEVLAQVDAAGLAVADVFLTSRLQLDRVTPTSRRPDDIDELARNFRACVDFATVVGSKGVTMLPGVVSPGETIGEAVESAAKGLAPLVAAALDVGLQVSVEPHVGSCIESPSATLELLDQCPGLTITLDPSHFGFLGWDVASMRPLIDRTRHVQIRPAGPGVMQCRLPDNELDLATLLDELFAHRYDGWIATELVWMDKWSCDRVDNTAETARLLAHLRALGEREVAT